MGKNKGGYNLLESYLASGLANQAQEKVDMSYIPLPDSMRTCTLLEQIGKERNWTEEQISDDIDILENNRLYYIRDLRDLSKYSWKKIELLPIVKDLLKKALNPVVETKKTKDKKMKKEKKKKQKGTDLGTPVMPKDTMSSSSSSSSSCSSEEESTDKKVVTTATVNENNKKVFTGRPIQVISGNRIKVRTGDGDIFETDRFCPHKKVDLSTWGQVVGRTLICSKHNWSFNLDGGLSSKGRNINPCKVNDW